MTRASVSLLNAASLILSAACGEPRPAVTSLDLSQGWELRRITLRSAGSEPAAGADQDSLLGADPPAASLSAIGAELDTTRWLPATVPGTVHTDLLAAGVIPDPFHRDHELRLRWIEGEDWSYRTRLPVNPDVLGQERVELVFDGLDTYAEVLIDGEPVLQADNMFRTWRVDVGDRLDGGDHRLEVRFSSPIVAAQPSRDALPYVLPAGNDRSDRPTRPFTRKAAYHYGWDWGPRFVTSGIWRPVRLEGWSGTRIRDVHWVQRSLSDEAAQLAAVVKLESTRAEQVRVRIFSPDEEFPGVSRSVRVGPGASQVELDFSIPSPERWWPNGLGEPHLYSVTAEVRDARRADLRTARLGLRTVEVITQPDSMGESFFVRVNGVPAFMRGANYVPLDHFTPRVGDRRYRQLFQAAREGHMNMLRVWGGGIYEDDLFYDLADEHGILIWQDFMFANGMYPWDDAFVGSVREEAAANVRRLRNHPSLALWCGNNEIEDGWMNWGWQTQLGYSPADSAEVWGGYQRIFRSLLPEVVDSLDPGRFYWPSSPSIGWGHEESLERGDSHYWGVWWGGEPFEVYAEKLPRFASEYGFQSYPALETIEAFTRPEDRRLRSPVMDVHQKHPEGVETILDYMRRDYGEPVDFEDFVYLSQVVQAEGVRIALEAHRRAMPRTMGTLYWQLNDTWPVASWSSLDYYGRWKALHHAARRAFRPLLLSAVVTGDTVRVYGVSDRLEPTSGRLEIVPVDFQEGERGGLGLPVTVAANASTLLSSIARGELLGNADPRRTALSIRLVSDGVVVAENLVYLAGPADLSLPRPTLRFHALGRSGGAYRLEVVSNVLARAVRLRMRGVEGRFEDNDFDLLPGKPRLVSFITDESISDVGERLEATTLAEVLLRAESQAATSGAL